MPRTSVSSETPRATCLGSALAWPCGRAAVHDRADERQHDQDRQEGEVVHARFTARRADDDEQGAERARTGRRSGRSRSGRDAGRSPTPPTASGAALDDAVDAVPVDDGQAADQVPAGADHQLVVDLVAVELGAGRADRPRRPSCGASRGTSLPADEEPGERRRRPRRSATTITETTQRRDRRVLVVRGVPVTGSRKSTIQSPISITPPSTDSAASTISGTVITLGDSCGWTSVGPALLGEERHQHQPGHVEAGDAAPIMASTPDQDVLVERGPR